MKPIQKIVGVKVVAIGPQFNRYVCWRNGGWDHTGSLLSATQFSSNKTAKKVIGFLRDKSPYTQFIILDQNVTLNIVKDVVE